MNTQDHFFHDYNFVIGGPFKKHYYVAGCPIITVTYLDQGLEIGGNLRLHRADMAGAR